MKFDTGRAAQSRDGHLRGDHEPHRPHGDKGLVERVRDSDDRRSVKIRLTGKGRQVVDLWLLLEHFGDTSLE